MNFRKSLPPDLYHQVTAAYPYRFTQKTFCRRDEVRLDRRWTLKLDKSCGRLARLGAKDLRGLMRHTFGEPFSRSGIAVHVRVDASKLSQAESYEMQVARNGVEICAFDDDGAMRALFHLGGSMLRRRDAVLKPGHTRAAPQWALRITSPVLHRLRDEPADYLDLPRSYLLNMARHGYNATYLYVDWFDLMTPAAAGRLARSGVRKRLTELRQSVEHLGAYGIRLLLHINTPALPVNHPIFRNMPSMRGAQTWSAGNHCLCSSSSRVLSLYRSAAKQLFQDVPGLGGAVLIVGGECFLHCYTRPYPQTNGRTNCPRCAEHTPDRVVASAVNAFTRGALEANPQANILVWPYSAFSWGNQTVQQRMLRQVDPRAACLITFEKDDWLTLQGTCSYIFDYAISQSGPSPLFCALQTTARRAGLKTYAKTETSQSIELFNVPRIPVMQLWANRYALLRQAKLDGVHTAWRLYGYCAQRTDEIVDYFNWAEHPDGDDLLSQLAHRDFGERAADDVVAAWRLLSKAFSRFPYGAGPTGFPYFRGPFALGPAHPFVFDLSVAIDLPEAFWATDPSIEEACNDRSVIAQSRQPRFFVDLTWTQPFGEHVIRKPLEEMNRLWWQGVSRLNLAAEKTSGDDQNRLDAERRIATMIGYTLRTAWHLLQFQGYRRLVTDQPTTPAVLRQTCRKAVRLLQNEIVNAEHALILVERDGSLGYGATYGYMYDAHLIRAKITHSQFQRDVVIPTFYQKHAFHCFGIYDELDLLEYSDDS